MRYAMLRWHTEKHRKDESDLVHLSTGSVQICFSESCDPAAARISNLAAKKTADGDDNDECEDADNEDVLNAESLGITHIDSIAVLRACSSAPLLRVVVL